LPTYPFTRERYWVPEVDAEAGSMVALLKYGTGMPFNRLEGLQGTLGIPLPAGAVTDLTALQITDAGGTPVPARFRALSKWWREKIQGKTDNPSVKWVLCDFQADVPAFNKAGYFVKDGGLSPSPANAINVVDEATKITVTTGPLKFTVSKTQYNIFDEVWLDANDNGVIDAVEGESRCAIKLLDPTSSVTEEMVSSKLSGVFPR